MRVSRKYWRVLILCLLGVSVFGPIFLLSDRLNSNLNVSKVGVQDLAIIKQRRKVQTLSVIKQEENEGLKVPPMVVRKDETSNSSVDFSFNKNVRNFGQVNVAGSDPVVSEMNVSLSRHELVKDARKRAEVNETTVSRTENDQSMQKLDERLKEMKDQVIKARAYISFAHLNGSPQLVKELRVRSREIERVMNHCIRESRVSRSALQKMKAMESTLSKARRTYPDCPAMVKKLRAMTHNAEEQIEAQRKQENFLRAIGGRTIPKGLHCLSMKLTAEYFAREPKKRAVLYKQETKDPNLYHFAVFSDNILACSVVVRSTIANTQEPERVVFHVVTDSLNFPAMSMWFLSNPPSRATVHVESIENFGWLSTKYNVTTLQKEGSVDKRYTSELNHLRFYLPDVFPYLNKIVLLDHDVVVKRDLTRLWGTNTRGKVNGAVQTCNDSEPSFRRLDTFIDFTDPGIANKFDANSCTWAFGMNVFDLREWQRRNLTAVYRKYRRLGDKKPFLFKAGSLPIGWLTFYKHTFALNKSWHVLGLGNDADVRQDDIDRAAVVHYDGIRKPWLDIGFEKYKKLWKKYVKFEHPYLQECNVHE
ncbi:probable galacturonosyltransferase 6 [Andrographis paniculata]|uniref:probable galacturonosyltransferase 6 n=1 Tax=Andrographis paniculata TaxID=175694 RepID=UPI0021E7440D|nr:probable galacturonosyltransferase 6 [Andrographis paniculata]